MAAAASGSDDLRNTSKRASDSLIGSFPSLEGR
jgi:hypothetical protein